MPLGNETRMKNRAKETLPDIPTKKKEGETEGRGKQDEGVSDTGS